MTQLNGICQNDTLQQGIHKNDAYQTFKEQHDTQMNDIQMTDCYQNDTGECNYTK
jgi:hypothetical protein